MCRTNAPVVLCLRVWCLRYCYRSCIIRTDSTEKKSCIVFCATINIFRSNRISPAKFVNNGCEQQSPVGSKFETVVGKPVFFFRKFLENIFCLLILNFRKLKSVWNWQVQLPFFPTNVLQCVFVKNCCVWQWGRGSEELERTQLSSLTSRAFGFWLLPGNEVVSTFRLLKLGATTTHMKNSTEVFFPESSANTLLTRKKVST